MNLNIDSKTLEACLKSVDELGGTIYRNICTGKQTYVEWGSGTWILFIAALAMAIATVFAFYKMTKDMIW